MKWGKYPGRAIGSGRVAVKIGPALLALSLTAGCGGGGGGSSSGPPSTSGPSPVPGPSPTPPPSASSVSAPALNNFTVTLAENVTSVSVGGAVSYTVTLKNTSGAAATVVADTVPGSSPPAYVPRAGLQITNTAGMLVYPPPTQPGRTLPRDNPPPPPPSNVVTLQPGEAISQTRALAVFSKADVYHAVATFTVAASSADTAQAVTLPALAVTAK